MDSESSRPFFSPIEDYIKAELDNYIKALKADAEFHVPKEIKTRIRELQAKLKEQQDFLHEGLDSKN